jgi:hypothetical protein
MGIFSNIIGTLSSFFQFGGPTGPGLNDNGGALEAKNSANTAFAILRGASPVGDNDLTTKSYADTQSKPIIASQQFNGTNPLPANSATEQFYVVTTTGVNASIGQLLWDDGSGTGTVTVLGAVTARCFVTAAAFSGGTISLVANSVYTWTGTVWTNVAPTAIELDFTVNGANVLASFQANNVLPMTGTLACEIEGYGGSGGGGGGEGGGASAGVGGGGSGGCQLQRSYFTHNLADRLDIIVGTGGAVGNPGGTPNQPGSNGQDGSRTLALDFTANLILAALSGTSGGQGGGPSPGRGGASYPGGVVIPKISDVNGPPYGSGFMLAGGEGGALNSPGTSGQGGVNANLIVGGGANWLGGQGGTSSSPLGGGGGGGGAGVLAPGGFGGNGQPVGSPGGNGTSAAPNSGAGVGGGAGGAGATDNGGSGGLGASGAAKLRFIAIY